jgi:hypothetical protein
MEDPIAKPIHRPDRAIGEPIRPDAPPLAIRMLKLGAEVRREFRVASQTVNERWILCQSIGIARRYGCWVAVGRDDVIYPLRSPSGSALP